MRLINVITLKLGEFFGNSIPHYAILSHTWGPEEVTFQDWQDHEKASAKAGWKKIMGACNITKKHRLEWLWVDTNCIDKTSSTELSEAINSMFDWYAKSKVCFAYLEDVDLHPRSSTTTLQQIRASRWFTRGWTLQELLAPSLVKFYSREWDKLGSKDGSLLDELRHITGIQRRFLPDKKSAMTASIAQKMSWLSKRQTTRVEDIAYCMLGLMDVNMPLLYGEGAKAFTRLQEEVIRISDDHTIFCWTWIRQGDAESDVPTPRSGMIAPSPACFAASGGYIPSPAPAKPYSMTNSGLQIRLPVLFSRRNALIAILNVDTEQIRGTNIGPQAHRDQIALFLEPCDWSSLGFKRSIIVASPLHLDRLLVEAPADELELLIRRGVGTDTSMCGYDLESPVGVILVSRFKPPDGFAEDSLPSHFSRCNNRGMTTWLTLCLEEQVKTTGGRPFVVYWGANGKDGCGPSNWFCEAHTVDTLVLPDDFRAGRHQISLHESCQPQMVHYSLDCHVTVALGWEALHVPGRVEVRMLYVSNGRNVYDAASNASMPLVDGGSDTESMASDVANAAYGLNGKTLNPGWLQMATDVWRQREANEIRRQ